MIIDQRRYTTESGKTAEFFDLQKARGFDLLTAFLERLVGYFYTIDDGPEQIVHLWRYKDVAEWETLQPRLYAIAELKPYFATARRILVRQENSFLTPFSEPALSPLWSLRDWLPAAGPVFRHHPELTVRETTLAFAPSALPQYLEVLAARAPHAAGFGSGLIGAFKTLVGRQHVVTFYRCTGGQFGDSDFSPSSACEHWTAIDAATRDLAPERTDRLLKPAPLPILSPMFDMSRAAIST